MAAPKVSIVMPAYNRAEFIATSIESILMQTFTDFELIIVDDGSTDNTIEIIEQYSDARISLIKHDKNKGVAAARNTGYRNAKGEYIVVSDSDDINEKNKLQMQVEFLDNNLSIGIVGCVYRPFSKDKILADWTVYEEDSLIRAEMLFWPGIQTASMFRKRKLLEFGVLYHDESFNAAVDYEWANKVPKEIKFSNLNEPLYRYRWHRNQISSNSKSEQIEYVWKLREYNLVELGIQSNEIDYLSHNILAAYYKYDFNELREIIDFNKLIQWCEKIIKANEKSKVYNENSLRRVINDKLTALFYYFEKEGINKWIYWYRYKYNSLEIPNISSNLLKKFKNKKIMILGTKVTAVIMYMLLEKEGYDIECFIDNKYQEKDRIENVKITNDEYFLIDPPDILIISIIGKHRFDVKKYYSKIYSFEIYLIDDVFI